MTTFIQHIHNRTTVTAVPSYTARDNNQTCSIFQCNLKFLCLTVSKPGKMWHGHNLMGGHWHIRHSTQNLLLRSAWKCYRSGPPKHHHCLPETLLPKMLVFKSSVGLIWIYIYSQLQTNMWDTFQGSDSVTQNYVAFTWISSRINVNKWGCIASQDMNSTILLLYRECVVQGSKKEKTMIEIKEWWSDGLEVMEKSWVTELQEDCLCQETVQFFSFKKQAGTFYITEIMWLGQVHPKFQLCYFVLVS